MLHQHVGQRLELGARVGGAGRVRRRIEDQPLRFWRDRAVERLRLHLEAVFHPGVDRHGRPAGECHHFRIADPIGRRDHDLVARIERRHQRVVEHLLAAGADADLRGLVVEAVLTLELGDDRRLEFRDAVDIGVFRRAPALDRLDRGRLDVVGRVEIRLAGAEPDHVTTRRFERARLVRHRDGGGGLDALERVREEGHVIISGLDAAVGNAPCPFRQATNADAPMKQNDGLHSARFSLQECAARIFQA